MKNRQLLWSIIVLAVAVSAPAHSQSRSYDHIHFSVPDPTAAQEWYAIHLGGVEGESPDRLAFGDMPFRGQPPLPVQLLWARSAEDARPVSGSSIENIAFSVADLNEKVRQLQTVGVKIVSPVHDVAGLWKKAVIEDPWGVRIELVEDPDLLGFHHVTLSAPDPEANLRWYLNNFGGELVRIGGQIDALSYGNMYLIVVEGAERSLVPGFGLNHIGWAAHDIDDMAARLKADGVHFTTEPRETLNTYGHRIAFVEGPNQVRIELVEHIECDFRPGPNEIAHR